MVTNLSFLEIHRCRAPVSISVSRAQRFHQVVAVFAMAGFYLGNQSVNIIILLIRGTCLDGNCLGIRVHSLGDMCLACYESNDGAMLSLKSLTAMF